MISQLLIVWDEQPRSVGWRGIECVCSPSHSIGRMERITCELRRGAREGPNIESISTFCSSFCNSWLSFWNTALPLICQATQSERYGMFASILLQLYQMTACNQWLHQSDKKMIRKSLGPFEHLLVVMLQTELIWSKTGRNQLHPILSFDIESQWSFWPDRY